MYYAYLWMCLLLSPFYVICQVWSGRCPSASPLRLSDHRRDSVGPPMQTIAKTKKSNKKNWKRYYTIYGSIDVILRQSFLFTISN